MNLLWSLVLVLQIVAALVMIGLVLIQHGKGADMGASFGSGASGSLFGATGSANFLSRSTAVCAGIFFVCTLALAYTSNDRTRPRAGSVLDRPSIARSGERAGDRRRADPGSGERCRAPCRAAAPAASAAGNAPAAAPAPVRAPSGAGAIPRNSAPRRAARAARAWQARCPACS